MPCAQHERVHDREFRGEVFDDFRVVRDQAEVGRDEVGEGRAFVGVSAEDDDGVAAILVVVGEGPAHSVGAAGDHDGLHWVSPCVTSVLPGSRALAARRTRIVPVRTRYTSWKPVSVSAAVSMVSATMAIPIEPPSWLSM